MTNEKQRKVGIAARFPSRKVNEMFELLWNRILSLLNINSEKTGPTTFDSLLLEGMRAEKLRLKKSTQCLINWFTFTEYF